MDTKIIGKAASTRSASSYNDYEDASDAVLRRVVRKVDWAIMPLMFLCYFLQFLDKVLINYANIMGISKSLKFGDGNDFSWMATAFFIGYAVAEFPQGYLIQRFPVTKVLGVNVILWGVVICCTTAAQDFPGVTAVRTLLGMFEAVITPALIMITSQWYTKRQATPRTGIWYCGLGVGQAVGGLISFAAQHGSTTSTFESWRIMFVSVGAFNLLVGMAVTFWLPNGIRQAKFLTEDEKSLLKTSLARDQAGNGRKVFQMRGLREAATDVQVWLLCLNTILIVIPSGIITTFSATLIAGFGYKPKTAALLNMPSGVVSVFSTLVGTCAILYDFPRWLAINLLLIPTLIGAGLMSFYSKSQAGALAGIYLINFDVAPLALIFSLVGANTQGYTKKVATNAAIAICFSLANIIGPQTFRKQDAPQYVPAKITVFGVCGGAMVVTTMLRLLYGWRNRRSEAARKAELELYEECTANEDLQRRDKDLTDRTNPTFRYVY
ncbi:Major facilitator superfamily domain, general substrate transporter [Moelleriella libera RCEF 2490]|uniref:Major facilitator superfamily domain, general substrate transporter n=1 Tax=Moelleriella libera RCEF 2490 TaxID=1081109 RepID=A0A168BNU7_9HYPO|nr:Major facilitator superfamily domain, general substrate transporter [Moelleriella libera RCEF 2490]